MLLHSVHKTNVNLNIPEISRILQQRYLKIRPLKSKKTYESQKASTSMKTNKIKQQHVFYRNNRIEGPRWWIVVMYNMGGKGERRIYIVNVKWGMRNAQEEKLRRSVEIFRENMYESLMSFLRAKYYCVSFVNNFLKIFPEFRSIPDTRPPWLSCSVFSTHWTSLSEHP